MQTFSLSKKQEKKIVRAIRKAELNSSGEIRVHISREASKKPLDKAVEVFHQLEMMNTKDRNGVLFHISLKDQSFTIVGDEGIDHCVPEDFWDEIRNEVVKNFTKEKYVKGLVRGIRMTGKALKKYFPHQKDDVNELPDEISWD